MPRPLLDLGAILLLTSLACGSMKSTVDVSATTPDSVNPGQVVDLVLEVTNLGQDTRSLDTVVLPAELLDRAVLNATDPPWTGTETDHEARTELLHFDGLVLEPGMQERLVVILQAQTPGQLDYSGLEVWLGPERGYASGSLQITGPVRDLVERGRWQAPSTLRLGEEADLVLTVTNNAACSDRLLSLKFDQSSLDALSLQAVSPPSRGTEPGNLGEIVNLLYDAEIPPGETLEIRLHAKGTQVGEIYEPVSVRLASTGVFAPQVDLRIRVLE